MHSNYQLLLFRQLINLTRMLSYCYHLGLTIRALDIAAVHTKLHLPVQQDGGPVHTFVFTVIIIRNAIAYAPVPIPRDAPVARLLVLDRDKVARAALERQPPLVLAPEPRPDGVPDGLLPPAVPDQAGLLVHVDPVEHGRVFGDGAHEPHVLLLRRVREVVSRELVTRHRKGRVVYPELLVAVS